MASLWRWGLAAIAAGALALRMNAIDFGLPGVYNPDEVAIMSRALAFAKGDLNPHNFVYPTFYFYLLFTWIGGTFVWQRLSGAVSSAAEFQARFFVDPTSVYVAGRTLSALCGAATTGAVALLGRTIFDRTTGAIAALMLAASPLAVQDAHYVKHDVPVTLVITLALWLMARQWTGAEGGPPSLRSLMLTAAVTGVAWSMHYYAVFLGVTLALTAWVSRRREGLAEVARTAALLTATAAAVFFLLSPFLLLEPGTAIRDIVANRQIVVDRGAEAGFFANLAHYVSLLITPGVSLPVAVFAAGGAARLAYSRPRLAVLLLSFPVTFALFIANTVPASRYLNPVLPIVSLLAADAVVAVARTCARPRLVLAGLVGVLLWMPIGRSVEVGRFFAQADTRAIARRIIESKVPAGSTVLVQPYSVPIHESRAGLLAAVLAHAGTLDRISTKSRLRLATSPWPHPAYRLLWLGAGGLDDDKIYVDPEGLAGDPIAALRARGVGFVVLKGFDEPSPALEALGRALSSRARLVASVSPYRTPGAPHGPPFLHNTDAIIRSELERPGPEIRVYQILEPAAEALQ